MRYLLIAFSLVINFNYFCSTTVEQSILGEFNLILNSQKEVLRKLSVKTIKSHTEDLFFKFGSVDALSFSVYITSHDDKFKSLTSKNIPTWAVGVARGNRIVIKAPTKKSVNYNNFKKILQHEISHLYLSQLNSKFPSWFNEGFSMYNAHEFNINRKINISWNLLLKRIVNLNQLKDFLSLSRSQSYLYYSQSAASIEAMIFYYGDEIIRNIIFYTKQDNNFNQAFFRATGGDTIDKFSVKYTSYLNNHFRFLFIYRFQKIVFFLISFLLLIIWFYKRKKNKKIMKLWEIEDQLQDFKGTKNENLN